MPRGIDSTFLGGKDYYYRQRPDVHGNSKIFLVELDGTSVVCNINGKEIYFPLLDLKKYYSNARTYMVIEKFEQKSMIMMDILYATEDVEQRLNTDNTYLNEFLKGFTRENINNDIQKVPGLIVAPTNSNEKRKFLDALKNALQDAYCDRKFPEMYHTIEEEQEVIDENYDYQNAKPDGIALEFVKDFYEIISRTKIRRPTEPKMKKIKQSLSRKVTVIKTGAIIMDDDVIGKYNMLYVSNVKDILDSISICLTGLDDERIFSDESGERLKRFGDALFESNILETFMYVNAEQKPIYMFAGRYNEQEGRLEVDKKIDKEFDKLNNEINKIRPDDGR